MSDYDYDLLVIGAGSGGVRASRIAAQLGAKVAIVEARHLGGTCVNVGCVPKKLFVYGSQYRDAFQKAGSFGWHLDQPELNWSSLRENKDKEIARLNQVYHKLLTEAGVRLLEGKASICGPHIVKVGSVEYSAERILITVGGWPQVPEFPGSEHVITSNDAFYLDKLPTRIMIVGGGYIGVEFAGIFNGLGVETHLCHRGELLLKGFDDDVRQFVADQMAKKGVHLHFEADVDRIEKNDATELTVHTKDGRQWQTEMVMYATGRRPHVDGLGLENTAVIVNDNGSIQVNDFFQTAEPSIYALGDVIGRLALTPVALAQGTALAKNLYAGQRQILDYNNIPTAVFSQPAIATVGLTEAAAREICTEIDVYKTIFKPLQFSFSNSNERTLMKLLVDRETDKVIGCHMVGPDAGEIMQGFAVALIAGATKKDFDNTLGFHPTIAEEFVSLRQPIV